MRRFADAHAHLDEPEFWGDQEQVIQRGREAGCGLFINVGIGPENSHQVVATAHRHPEVFATVGVHPHGVGTLKPELLEALTPLTADPKVVAVGEIGLDFYRRRAPQEVQKHWFRQQLDWALALKKVVVIHMREATADTLAILQDYRSRLSGGVMHCFAGSPAEAKSFLDLGLYLSFSGVLTYPKAEALRQVAKNVPLERLLLETDCPYLPAQPWRGKRNEPAYLTATLETLAKVRGLGWEEVAAATWNNTLAAFGIKW